MDAKDVERYAALYLGDKEDITTFQPLDFLEAVADSIKAHPCSMCFREPMCDCRSECDCDHDDFTTIKSYRFENVSNCRGLIDITTTKMLKHEDDTQTKKSKSEAKLLKEEHDSLTFRVFELDAGTLEERPVLDIDRYHGNATFYFMSKVVSFPLMEKVTYRDKVLTLTFNYMDFDESCALVNPTQDPV